MSDVGDLRDVGDAGDVSDIGGVRVKKREMIFEVLSIAEIMVDKELQA